MNGTRRFSRRRFLQNAAATGGVLTLGGLSSVQRVFSQSALPSPDTSGIEHIVVLMMENRSFDHMLGWLDGADGRQRGLRYADNAGVLHRTYRLAPDFQGCGHADPDHSYEGGRIEYNDGACDGWLRAGNNDELAIGFYTKQDLPFLGDAAPQWTVCDHYFSAIMAGTFANRVYQHAAQTDRLANTFELSTLPTIWDRLAEAGLDGRYYFSDIPFLALWGAKYVPIGRPYAAFLADAAAGTLPHVSFVEPRFLGEEVGASNDDHPFADIRNGCGHQRSRVGKHCVRDQLRRVGWLLRSRAAADGTDSRCRCRRRERRRSAWIPDTVPGDLTVRATRTRGDADARSHIDSQDDRMAVGPGCADRSR